MWNDASEKKKTVQGSMLLTRKKKLIRGVSATETNNTRDTIRSAEFKKQKAKELKEKWSEK